MKRSRLILILAAILAVAAAAYLLSAPDENAAYTVSYPQFLEALDAGEIASARIGTDHLVFTTKSGEKGKTANPGSPDFREKLLLAGVSVETEGNSEDRITFALDMLFDAIFFGAAIFGLVKLINFSRSTFRVVRHTGVHFDDIAGMEKLKREMAVITDILKNPAPYQKKGIRPIKGIILEGPPGNGKTLFAKALAEETDVKFIAAKGADFQSALMSMGARKIKMLFRKAARNKPCIIFIDEFDSIGERRNYAGSGIDKENNRIITTMLNEMDGFTSGNGVLVIAATNSYQSLDPALIRPGRFDLKYNIGNPDTATRAQLIDLYTRGKSLDASLTKDSLVREFDGLSCAAIETLFNEAAAIAGMEGRSAITREDILDAAQKTDVKLKKSGK